MQRYLPENTLELVECNVMDIYSTIMFLITSGRAVTSQRKITFCILTPHGGNYISYAIYHLVEMKILEQLQIITCYNMTKLSKNHCQFDYWHFLLYLICC